MDDIKVIKDWLSKTLKTEVYDGKINEYVDWTTGINELTGSKISGLDENAVISGKSIRDLIQSRLKKPFVTYTDDISGKILFFSSDAVSYKWQEYMKQYRENGDEEAQQKALALELYKMDMPATYKITGLEEFKNRYMIAGNSTSDNSKLEFYLNLEDSLGTSQDDTLTIQYEIKDNNGILRYKDSDQIDTGDRRIKNIYNYLSAGENSIDIVVKANNYAARATKHFKIFLVTFSIETDFSGYYTPVANGSPIIFTAFVHRSVTNLPVTTTIKIDGQVASFTDQLHSDAEWVYSDNLSDFSERLAIYNPASTSADAKYLPSDSEHRRIHVMTIQSVMQDPESNVGFTSNTLTYEFEIAPITDDLQHVYINLAMSMPSGSYNPVTYQDVDGNTRLFPKIQTSQYIPTVLNWGYNTDAFYSDFNDVNVEWAIRTGQEGSYIYETLANIQGSKGYKPDALVFIPSKHLSWEENNSYLVARVRINGVIVDKAIYPLSVTKSDMTVSETGNYRLKLSAYGKTNTSETKEQWVDELNAVTTTFHDVAFDSTNGWNNNSLSLKGTSSYAIINYCPFPERVDNNVFDINQSGSTIEIDFKPEYISDENDSLVTIGSPTGPHITIHPTFAAYYSGASEASPLIKTNYKSGERIKLAFIFNSVNEMSSDSNLIFIVNNGILERAKAKDTIPVDITGNIKIGGSNSSIKVYMIRAYRYALTTKQALSNYMFDNANDVNLLSRNDIYGNSSVINYDEVKKKQDIITIEGDLYNLLHNASAKMNSTVNMERFSSSDPSKNFKINNCRIRNHGQSTLSYPITSMKIWFNKSNLFDEATGKIETIPTFTCDSQAYLELNKNRYVMKDGAIPSNKFVLQANYADSSGTHNGSLLRLIQDTWYKAKINGEYKLRTAPQLFASGAKITHNNTALNEPAAVDQDPTTWVEGVCNVQGSNYGKTWPEITGVDFPYKVRVAPDSFPCTVFYKNIGDSSFTLLGQYVFMDDKKSDFVFGERSIYKTEDLSDPFCLKSINAKKDKNENKVWDNSKVLQVEVVFPNSPLTNYLEKEVAVGYNINEDEEGEEHEQGTDSQVRDFRTVMATDGNGKPTEFLWERHFELIYPDKEDITDKNDKFDSDKFVSTVQPFVDFFNWITDVAALRNTGTKGLIDDTLYTSGAKSYVTQAELNKFKQEAHDHLDLYKLAAYYIFFQRFGLVDSVVRNAQLKTYDGQHWHYEPWDMDVALGCANNGVIAYDPPITRDTLRAGVEGSYIYAGRSGNQSNVLWDCLESWDYWMTILVPEVAQALYEAGLSYNNAIKMFDEEYVAKWSETLYNESGHYKYIDAAAGNKYRQYLNGARTSHRHWWLSKSMNYFDAKWSCGDFEKHNIWFRLGKSSYSGNDESLKHYIKIYPTQNTFFEVKAGTAGNLDPVGGLTEAGIEAGQEAIFDVSSLTFGDKSLCFIYGATAIRKLDLSGLLSSSIEAGYTDITLGESYDEVLGGQIRELIMGAPCTPSIYTSPNATSYTSNLSLGQNQISGISEFGNDALENLELLDINGLWATVDADAGQLSKILHDEGYDRTNVTTIYAMGCNHATSFASSNGGNKFIDLRLPSTVTSLTFTNSSWQNLSFWDAVRNGTTATYNKITAHGGIPASIDIVNLSGTTGKNECSLQLVLNWIDAIDASLPVGHTEEDLYNVLKTKTLNVDQAYWGTDNNNPITYNDVIRLSKFNQASNIITAHIKGYVLIQDDGIGMTTERVAELQGAFGNNIFNIGAVSSSLVIDYHRDSVVISVSSTDPNNPTIEVINNEITLHEPNSALLRANHFTLTKEDTDNQIVDAVNNNPSNTASFAGNKYIWGFVNALDASQNTPMSSTYNSATLVRGADGQIRIQTTAGNGSDYYMYIRVMYGKDEGGTINVYYNTVAVKVIGITYPSGYHFNVYSQNANDVQQFKCTSAIARGLFGQAVSDNMSFTGIAPNDVSTSNIYIIRKPDQRLEFYLQAEGSGYTANLNDEIIQFTIQEIGTNRQGSLSRWVDSSAFSGIKAPENDLGYGTYVNTAGNSQYKGIPIVGQSEIEDSLGNNIILFEIKGRIRLGGMSQITKTAYLLVIDDADPIVTYDSTPLSTALWNTYSSISVYNIPSGQTPDIYRTQLLSLYGTLDFSSYTSLASLNTEKNDSVLKYIPYINSLDFSGCTQLPSSALDFSQSVGLTSLNLTNCTNLNGTLDLSTCTELTTLITTGSNIGIKLPQGTKVNSLTLGSPYTLEVDTPTVLGNDGTYSIASSANLQSANGSLKLINVNSSSETKKGFTMFGNLFNVGGN